MPAGATMPLARRGLALAACAIACSWALAAATPNTGLPDAFVKVKSGRLVIGPDCKEFYLCAPRPTAAV